MVTMIFYDYVRYLPPLILAGAGILLPAATWAGSCCGGGSSTALMVPKYARAVADLSFDAELYDGFWNQNGSYTADPRDPI